jgi:hypothetical protein
MLNNTDGWANVACGVATLSNNTLGIGNTAVGYRANFSNTTGSDNTTVGNQAMFSSTTSSGNTAVGTFALQSNVVGDLNTAVGKNALLFSTSNRNTAIGSGSLETNTTGAGNTAIGALALQFNTTGDNNTVVGRVAGSFTGFNPSNFGAFGYIAGYVGSNSNTIEIGNTSVSWIGGQVGFFNYSDGRIKKNVQHNVPGLSFIKRLRPVTYYLDIHKQNEIVYKDVEIGDWEGKYDLENELQTGFIAQEVEEAAVLLGYNFNGVKAPKNEKDLYSIQYASFVVPLVKAVQEQQEIIENQNAKIKSLEDRLKALEEKLTN